MLDHLFSVGIGRPCTIRDQDVTAAYPSLAGDAPVPPSVAGGAQGRTANATAVTYIATTSIYTRKLLRIVRVLDPL